MARQDAREFAAVLTQVYQGAGQISLLYNSCKDGLRPLAVEGLSPDVIWNDALQKLAAAGALRQLCDLVLQKVTNPVAQAKIVAVINAPSPTEELFITDDIFLLDRKVLRSQLDRLIPEQNSLKVVLVLGESGSGKTHSRYLFSHLARNQGAEPVYIREGMVATVEDVMKALVSPLGVAALQQLPTRSQAHTTEDAWYADVCRFLQATAMTQAKQLWIAVDDLGVDSSGAPLLDRQIRQFFDHFVIQMQNPAFSKYFRLMLINYPDGPVPVKWDTATWTRDKLTGSDVSEHDVAFVLAAWSKRHQVTMLEDQIQTLSAQVVAYAQTANAAGRSRIDRIAQALQQTMQQLLVTKL
ncbi:hypothetical protein GCM10027348_38810 [Hymenobacter tenuis]